MCGGQGTYFEISYCYESSTTILCWNSYYSLKLTHFIIILQLRTTLYFNKLQQHCYCQVVDLTKKKTHTHKKSYAFSSTTYGIQLRTGCQLRVMDYDSPSVRHRLESCLDYYRSLLNSIKRLIRLVINQLVSLRINFWITFDGYQSNTGQLQCCCKNKYFRGSGVT